MLLLIAFVLLLLACMGIAKLINRARKQLTVNGAGYYLLIFAIYCVWIWRIANQTDPITIADAYASGQAFGHLTAAGAFVSVVALYFFFDFRREKAWQKQLRKRRAVAEPAVPE